MRREDDPMANRPEIKIYPVEFYPAPAGGHAGGDQWAHQSSRKERNERRSDVHRYLHALVGKHVTVHTSSSGPIQGVLEAVLSDAIVLRTESGQVLIHDWAIATIESE
jgi:hypothetical protein